MKGAPERVRGTTGHFQRVLASGSRGIVPSVMSRPGHAALSVLKDSPRVSPLLRGKRRTVYLRLTGPFAAELFLMV